MLWKFEKSGLSFYFGHFFIFLYLADLFKCNNLVFLFMAHKLVYCMLRLKTSLWRSCCFKNGCANFTLLKIWNLNLQYLGSRSKFYKTNAWHIIRGTEFTYFCRFQAAFTFLYVFCKKWLCQLHSTTIWNFKLKIRHDGGRISENWCVAHNQRPQIDL